MHTIQALRFNASSNTVLYFFIYPFMYLMRPSTI